MFFYEDCYTCIFLQPLTWSKHSILAFCYKVRDFVFVPKCTMFKLCMYIFKYLYEVRFLIDFEHPILVTKIFTQAVKMQFRLVLKVLSNQSLRL